MKKEFLLFCLIFVFFISCEKDFIKEDVKKTDTETTTDKNNSTVFDDPSDYIWDNDSVRVIELKSTSIECNSVGVDISGTTATIISAGNYKITGTLNNGQIIVNTEDNEVVRLILDGAIITSSTSAPIFVEKAKRTILVLSDGTENTLTDGANYIYASSDITEPNAALYSKDDLTIFGNGNLTVKGNYKDGIACKDGLLIKSGTINVTAADDGIHGKDYLVIRDGDITVTSTGDGIKSDNDSGIGYGYMQIENGTINITSGGDAIAGYTNVLVESGSISITSGGGSNKTVSSTLSAKGIKAGDSLIIKGGDITVNSADDALHSNNIVSLMGGNFTLAAGDDGIHAETLISIENVEMIISKSYEAIESATITVNTSNMNITATNDGFNASKGLTAGGAESNDGSNLTIKGGTIVVNVSSGDGLDSNGDILISSGNIIVHGPSSQPEVGIDYNGNCLVTGGFLVVSGTSSNMTQAPSASSTQYCLRIFFTSAQAANSIVHIEDSKRNPILTFAPVRSYQSIIVSSSILTNGSSYSIYTGGSSTGTLNDGLYTDGTYSGGTSYTTFTVSGIITTVGSSSGGPGR